MAKPGFKNVDDYLAAQPAASRIVLIRVRDAIRKAIPQADEGISYQIPAYKLGGAPVIYFAGWKQHYSIYPATSGVLAALAGKLTGLDITKGTIRFPLDAPVPIKLIERIARERAKEVIAAKSILGGKRKRSLR